MHGENFIFIFTFNNGLQMINEILNIVFMIVVNGRIIYYLGYLAR